MKSELEGNYVYPSGLRHDLTKRELFAAMAMQGLLSNDIDAPGIEVIRSSVAYADALLAELAKEPQP